MCPCPGEKASVARGRGGRERGDKGEKRPMACSQVKKRDVGKEQINHTTE